MSSWMWHPNLYSPITQKHSYPTDLADSVRKRRASFPETWWHRGQPWHQGVPWALHLSMSSGTGAGQDSQQMSCSGGGRRYTLTWSVPGSPHTFLMLQALPHIPKLHLSWIEEDSSARVSYSYNPWLKISANDSVLSNNEQSFCFQY